MFKSKLCAKVALSVIVVSLLLCVSLGKLSFAWGSVNTQNCEGLYISTINNRLDDPEKSDKARFTIVITNMNDRTVEVVVPDKDFFLIEGEQAVYSISGEIILSDGETLEFGSEAENIKLSCVKKGSRFVIEAQN